MSSYSESEVMVVWNNRYKQIELGQHRKILENFDSEISALL